MLSTEDRSLLVDLLSAPDGHRLEHAVGTTFTLDLESMFRVPLAFAGAEWRADADPLGVMHAVQSTVDRFDVFCQAGMVRVPAGGAGILAFLEPAVHQVTRPSPGHLFHPKIWVTSFVDGHGDRQMRMLCGSRNLTGDRTWDAVLRLDGIVTGRPRALNGELARFVAGLAERSVHPLDPRRATSIGDLADCLRRTEWEAPDGAIADDWLRFHVFGAGHRPDVDLSGGRRLIISPFLTLDGVERSWPTNGSATIVSRAESFAVLTPEERSTITDEWGADLLTFDDSAAVPDLDDDDAGRRWELSGLHAKVYVVERNRRAHVFIGSLNATENAWTGNDEILVEIVGRPKTFGIDRVLSTSSGGLGSVLMPFIDGATEAPPDDELVRRLERALITVAEQPLVATAASALVDDTWSETVSSSVPLPTLDDGVDLSIRLLSTHDERTPATSRELDETWTGLGAEELTPFVAVTLRAGPPSARIEASTIVMATMSGAPDDRLDRLLAAKVGSPEAFLRFLLLLLQGDSDEMLTDLADGSGDGTAVFGLSGDGVLEAVAMALADRPEVLDDVDRLVARLLSTDAGREVLPPGWNELWDQVIVARRMLTEAGS